MQEVLQFLPLLMWTKFWVLLSVFPSVKMYIDNPLIYHSIGFFAPNFYASSNFKKVISDNKGVLHCHRKYFEDCFDGILDAFVSEPSFTRRFKSSVDLMSLCCGIKWEMTPCQLLKCEIQIGILSGNYSEPGSFLPRLVTTSKLALDKFVVHYTLDGFF